VVGLALAAWRGAGFAAARTVGAVGAATLGAALAFSRGGEDAAVSVVYFALLVALTHGELVWSAALGRLGIVRGGGAASVDAAGDAIGGRSGGAIARWLAHRFGGVSGLVLSPAVTGVSVATAVHVVGLTDAAGWRWAVAAAGAVALVVAGRTLLGRTERDEAAGDARPVGVVLFAEGLALVFAAVLLGFAGWAEPAVFLGLGAAVAIASRTRDIAWMAWYGLASLALGTLRAVMHEASAHAFSGPHTFIAGVAWSRWSLLAFAAAVCWGVGAWGVGGAALGARSARRAASSAWVIAAALLFAAPLHERTEAASLVYLWIGLAATLVAYRFLLLSRRSDAPTDLPPTTLERAGLGSTMASALAAGGLVLGLGAWAAAFGPSRSVAWRDSPSALFFHPGFIAAIVWSVVAGAFAMAHRPAPGAAGAGRDAVLRAVGVWAAGVMVFATSSLEVARAAFALTDNELSQRAAVSLWWGVYGAAVLLAGWWRSVGAARVTGLVLILVASAKALLYDIAGVEPVWRVVALLGLGLLMMVVAAFYLRGRIARPGSNAEPGDRLRDAGGGDGGVAEA
jgi:hypothetical protein